MYEYCAGGLFYGKLFYGKWFARHRRLYKEAEEQWETAGDDRQINQ